MAPKSAPSLQRGHDDPCRSPGEYGLILIALAQAPESAAALQGVIENATAACSYHGLDLRTVNDDIKLLAGVPAPC